MGNIIIINKWEEREGISVVECIEDKQRKEFINFYSFLNSEKEFINDCRYENVSCFKDGFAKVKNDSFWGVIDNKGKEIIPSIYKHIFCLPNKLFQVCINNLWGIINSVNKIIIPITYDYVFPPFHEYVVIKQNDKFGVSELNGIIFVKIECYSFNEALMKIKKHSLQF